MSLADAISANFGVPSPGAVNDKLIAYFKNTKTGNGSPVGASMGPGFYWDLTNFTLYTNPNADNTSWVVFGNGTYASVGKVPTNVVTKTTTYTAVAGDLVLADTSGGGWTLTLPAAPTAGQVVGVKKTTADANLLTISPNVDGIVLTVMTAGRSFIVEWDGAAWRVAYGNGAAPADIQVFISSGTWTKPTNPVFKTATVIAIGGGGGGGGGRRGAAGSVRCGGGGGAGAAMSAAEYPLSLLGTTESVTVGAGGVGGAAQTVDSTDGNAASAAGHSFFGGWLFGARGGAGSGGTTSSGAGGGGGAGFVAGGNGAAASATGGVGAAGNANSNGTAAGGAGGGITSGDSPSAGGAGGGANAASGGSGGFRVGGSGGAVGVAGSSPAQQSAATEPIPGAGGGGGGGSITGAAGGGGMGAQWGGGGGGGGASLNGNSSGAGGNGGPGIVVVISQ